MTHQKIAAEDIWGAIPMTPFTIEQLVFHLNNKPDYDPELSRIAERWQAGDFSEVAAQHNDLNTKLKADVGQASGNATQEQEKKFVLKYFDASVAQELGFQ